MLLQYLGRCIVATFIYVCKFNASNNISKYICVYIFFLR